MLRVLDAGPPSANFPLPCFDRAFQRAYQNPFVVVPPSDISSERVARVSVKSACATVERIDRHATLNAIGRTCKISSAKRRRACVCRVGSRWCIDAEEPGEERERERERFSRLVPWP